MFKNWQIFRNAEEIKPRVEQKEIRKVILRSDKLRKQRYFKKLDENLKLFLENFELLINKSTEINKFFFEKK